MYPRVIEVVPHDDYTLAIVFDNGESGIFDVKPILDLGIFQRLRVPGAFACVRVAFDTVQWECGADLDPEFVYAKCSTQMPT